MIVCSLENHGKPGYEMDHHYYDESGQLICEYQCEWCGCPHSGHDCHYCYRCDKEGMYEQVK